MYVKQPYNKLHIELAKYPMTREHVTRNSHLEAKVSPDALAIIKRAAELQGRSVSDFVVTAAQEIAQRTIEETNFIRLSLEDQQCIVNLLIDPPELNPAMQRAAKAHADLIQNTLRSIQDFIAEGRI